MNDEPDSSIALSPAVSSEDATPGEPDNLPTGLMSRYSSLEHAFDHAPVGMALFDASPPHRVLFHNHAYRAFVLEPWRTHGVAGKTIPEFLPGAGTADLLSVFSEVARTGESRTFHHFPFDGFSQERTWWDWSLSPIVEDGQVVALIQISSEVTAEVHARQQLEEELVERRRAEEALVQHEIDARQQLEAAIAHAPAGIVLTDPEARIVMTNPAAEHLYARPIPRGEPFERHAALQLYYPDGTPYDPSDLPLTRSALHGETHEKVEMLICWPDGQQRHLLVNTAPICDRQGRIQGAIGVFQDITAHKRAVAEREMLFDELAQLNRALEKQAVEREQLLAEFTELNRTLEKQVETRTAALRQANTALRAGMEERARFEDELAEVRRRLAAGREAERLELGQALHNRIVQDLYGIGYRLNVIGDRLERDGAGADLEAVQKMLYETARALRVACEELRPPTLIPFGLAATIRSHAERLQGDHPELRLHLDLPYNGQTLPQPLRLALFRIYQEVVLNSVIHARAENVFIRLHLTPAQVTLEIEDDGVGFTLPERWVTLAREGRLGLVGARELTEAIDGTLDVSSRPGAGTIVRLTAPRAAG